MSSLRCNFTSNQFLKGKKISSDYVHDLIKFKKRNFYFNRHIIRQKLQFIDFHKRNKPPALKKSASVGTVNYFKQEKKKEEFMLTSYFDHIKKNYISHSNRNNHCKEEIAEKKVPQIQDSKVKCNVNEQSNKMKLPTIKTNDNNSIRNQNKIRDNYHIIKKTTFKHTVNDNHQGVSKVKQNNNQQRLKNKSTSPDNSITNFFQQTNNTPTLFPSTTINKPNTLSSYRTPCKLSSYSYFSLPGTKMQLCKENQDSILILPNLKSTKNTPCHVFGVFDGHGDSGKNISELASTYIHNYYTNIEHISFTKETIKTCIHTISSTIKQHSDLDLQFSGTTLNMVCVDTDKHYLYCANIGDSRSIAITCDYDIIQLSTEHNPEHPIEYKRILQMGGEVGRVNWSNEGPCRVWLKGKEYPGLSVSRSIGDLIVENIGVISEPEVTMFNICNQLIKIVVIGTDGLWEFLSNEQIKDIVCMYYDQHNNTFDSKAAGNKLISESRKVWELKNPLGIDDISVIILFFD